MKQIKQYIACLVTLLTWASVFSQVPNCQNLGFELGNFTNWEGTSWRYSTEHPEYTTAPRDGIVHRRHTIMTNRYGYDPKTGNELKLIPQGHRYSCRLGDVIIDRVTDPLDSRCWHQNLRYTMEIDESNALLIIKFALVLEYAADHLTVEEPRFRFTLYDQNGDTIPDCANYDVYATNEDVEGFHYLEIINPPDGRLDRVMWRDWTTVGVNLSGYIGQTITIEFMTADCIQTHHFGYAYFVASCLPLNITIGYCETDTTAWLSAPVGFDSYVWTDDYGEVIDTLRILDVDDPVEGSSYYCTLTSATNCVVTLSSTISRFIPEADFSSFMIDCNSNTVQLTNSSTTSNGELNYFWDFGDGNTSFEREPEYTFITSGKHQVSLTLTNPPSSCRDFLTKEVESFSPPLVGIEGYSTYCPGESVSLKGYGAYYYNWSTGSDADSIEVSAPGGEISLIGRSTTGCIDTNYIVVSEEPEWDLFSESDTVLCVDDTTLLMVSGAVEHLWNTGDTTNSILVSTPGSYSVVGKNRRGCEKTKVLNVELSPPPEVDFVLSDYTLDSRNNEITGSLPTQTDVQYLWNMDDGSTETGSVINHRYNISNLKLYYEVSLEATDKYGCKNSTSEFIDVVPFVPNVFSPNGDGINDVFMPGLELQIFDRYGVELYNGIDGWDGRYKNQSVDPDTYFYTILYADRNQVEKSKKGSLTLVR